MKCQKCEKKITKRDISEGNHREGFGGDYHEVCPDTKCFICGKEIKTLAGAAQTMAGTWRHKNCNPKKIHGGGEPIESPQEIERWYNRDS